MQFLVVMEKAIQHWNIYQKIIKLKMEIKFIRQEKKEFLFQEFQSER